MNKGNLYLIPTILGDDPQKNTLPPSILQAIKEIDIFITENVKTSRRHIKKISPNKDISTITFYPYGKHDYLNLEETLLNHILSSKDVGLISEAGLPCIADPGAKIVEYAHNFQINVIPLVGPSSILLALMASGLNGQNFAFNGYLPIKNPARIKAIKRLEEKVKKYGQTQIFMETPYRNHQVFEALLKKCSDNIKLCIATNLSLINENIKTKTIAEWKQTIINIHKKPTIFLIG